MSLNIDKEIELLKGEIKRLAGTATDGEGHPTVKFGVLVMDDKCADTFEALAGTLRAAKRGKVITYDSELLLKGVHDNIDIVLLSE